MKKVTVADIARAAGVSPGTVSNALNNRKGSLSEEKRAAIIAVAEQMGYVRKKKTSCLRLIIFREGEDSVTDNAFFESFLNGISKECASCGYQLLVNHLLFRDWKQGFSALDDPNTCDGIMILATYLREEHLYIFDHLKLPHVFIDIACNDQTRDYVVMNNHAAVYELTKILIKAGFRHIGFATVNVHLNNLRERKAGYLSALHDQNIEHDSLYDLLISQDNIQSVKDQLSRLKKTKRGLPEVYVCANDFIACIMSDCLRDLGFSAHLTGFDNINEGELRQLTTINVNKDDYGRASVRRILDLIDTPDQTPQRVNISTQIIVRGSLLNI